MATSHDGIDQFQERNAWPIEKIGQAALAFVTREMPGEFVEHLYKEAAREALRKKKKAFQDRCTYPHDALGSEEGCPCCGLVYYK